MAQEGFAGAGKGRRLVNFLQRLHPFEVLVVGGTRKDLVGFAAHGHALTAAKTVAVVVGHFFKRAFVNERFAVVPLA